MSQITKSNTSVTIQGDYIKWQTQKALKQSRGAAQLETILQIIRSANQKMKKNCTGCKESDKYCNCTVEVRRENEFDILILLDTEKGLKWCPTSTVDSMYFNCQPGSFMKIRASQVCDGFGDCPQAEDESNFLCQSPLLIMMICAVVQFVYGLAIILTIFYCCREGKAKAKKSENKQYRKGQATKKNLGIRLRKIHKISDENKQLKKRGIKIMTRKMAKNILLHLIIAADNVPTTSQKSTLLKPVVQNVISESNNLQEMLTAVKNLPISNRLKNRIFSTHTQGVMTRMKYAVSSRIQNRITNMLSLFLSISLEILNLCMTATQEIKDLGLIATMYFFYNEVLQKRPWLVDGINLNNYVLLLSGIYIFTTMLKLLRASNTLKGKENKEINLAVRMIPFFNETFLSFKIIQGTSKLFNMRNKIGKSIKKMEHELVDEVRAWENITITSDHINQEEANLETRKQARMRVKICSVLGDIMQASVLAILLLRSDLRVRGALVNFRMNEYMGRKADDGGTQGELEKWPLAVKQNTGANCQQSSQCSLYFEKLRFPNEY